MNRRGQRLNMTMQGCIVVAVLVLLLATPPAPAGEPSAVPPPQGTNATPPLRSEPLARFRLAEWLERKSSQLSTWTNQDEIVKIEAIPNIDEEGAKLLLQEGLMNVEALYANALSPYPGDISRNIVTEKRFLPQLIRTNWNDRAYQYYLVFANERLGYGAVTADAVRYRSILGWIHCPDQGVFYKLRYYVPLHRPAADAERFFLSLRCP